MITGPFSNLTYTLPVVVLQNQTINNNQASILESGEQLSLTVIAFAVLVVILVMAIILRRRIGIPRYDRGRAERMLRIRQRVKRELDDEQ